MFPSRLTSILFLTISVATSPWSGVWKAAPFLLLAYAEEPQSEPDLDVFFASITDGDVEHIAEEIEKYPGIANAVTRNGESGLHLVALSGSAEIAKLLIDNGGDVNLRTKYSQGLRMHPLSWNVYRGHHEIVRLLLDAGADIHADFDVEYKDSEKVTVTDIASRILEKRETTTDGEEPDGFELTHKLLLERGGKTYRVLHNLKFPSENGYYDPPSRARSFF